MIFYYILCYWVVVQLLAPIGSPPLHPHPRLQQKSPASRQFYIKQIFADFV